MGIISNKLPAKEVKKFLIIFYIVGVTGFLLPYTRNIFIYITPMALLLNVFLLLKYHPIYSVKYVSVVLFLFISGYFIEVAGVNTGVIFGMYNYGNTLGLKLLNTPLIIGINWVFLTYASLSVSSLLIKNSWMQLVVAPAIMVVYDVVMEQVAPRIDMWHWQGNVIPVKNYISWFVIGLFFVSLFKLLKIDTRNPLAVTLLVSQFVFFFLLMLFLH